MNLSKRQKISHSNGLLDTKLVSNRYLKQINMLSCENDTLRSFEYVFRPSMYTDTIPVQIGHFILASSKLHILKVFNRIHVNIVLNHCSDSSIFDESSFYATFSTYLYRYW